MRRPGHKHLVIFARAPRLCRVKRRLGAEIGAVAALRFYRIQLHSLMRRLSCWPRWRLWLAITPDHTATDDALTRIRIGGCRRPAVTVLPQGDGDLGRRMARICRMVPPGPVVIVGSDVPAIRSCHPDRAFAALGRAPAVFGPSPDGGFWLFGLARTRAVPHGLFRAVRWSGAHSLTDSRHSLPAHWRVAMLDRLEDVDDASSYRRAGGARAGVRGAQGHHSC